MINKRSVKKTRSSKSASAETLVKRLNAILTDAPAKGQYTAIKEMVSNREVAALKQYFEIEEYISAHEMRWVMINAYNEGNE